MAHVVAITRAPSTTIEGGYREVGTAVAAPIDTWLVKVAGALSMTPYDLRLRVAGPVPWLVARVASVEDAAAPVARLREVGCGAVSFDPATIAFDSALTARAFAREDAVWLEPGPRALPYDQLSLVVHATLDEELGVEVTRFAPNTYDGITSHSRARDKRQALYLCPEAGGVVRLVEGTLGFPEETAPTVRGRFGSFVGAVRAKVGAPRFRDAFVAEPRKRTSMRALSQSETHRSTVQGNVAETDLAVAALLRGLVEAQL